MAASNAHSRRYLIAAGAILALGASAYGFERFYPALGPIAGAVTPQLYVDSLPGAQIPVHGRYVLVDAASARLYMIEDGRVGTDEGDRGEARYADPGAEKRHQL